ncbi:MAG TPA: alpha-L-arabinofuranosidase C-terminal domain-containing protein [Bacteroidales bacterium]|nr:alpha-L-arabinofuranosidase C-terminal domain-containing protein [Bacteroidales bacterium]
MKKYLFLLISIVLVSCTEKNAKEIRIDPSKRLYTVTDKINGANVEDLNFQCYGGMLSQLLYGQDFEEQVDVDFLNLPSTQPDYKSMTGPGRIVTFVMLDEKNKPYLTTSAGGRGVNPTGNPVTKTYELNSREVSNRFIPVDSLKEDAQKILLERVNGDKQISRYWKEVNSGTAKGIFKLITKGQYKGRRDQLVRFVSGEGEVGLDNMGLLRMGINFQDGKNYEGVLRVKNLSACTIYVSLLKNNGIEKLAEKAIQLKASPSSYQRVEFDLVPSGSDPEGRFAISLKEPGEIVLGYAFLEPGEWGRVEGGYHIRKDFIEAMRNNGMKIIRYNGSMNNMCPDSMMYTWKNMIGPLDERLPYTGNFTPYATHGFGIFEFLTVAEAADLEGIVGISKLENPSGIKDMIEYANGPVTSKWGAARARDGHPDPFNLKYIQISNEVRVNPDRLREYFQKFKNLATEIWKADSSMYLFTSINVRASNNLNRLKGTYNSNPEYIEVREFLRWVKEQGKEDQLGWDSHYNGRLIEPDSTIYRALGLELQDVLLEDIGYNLKLWPLEENGAHHTFERGITHARLQNHLNRWGNRLEAAATANLFQPEAGFMTFSQGRIFYDSDSFWNQTSGHVDQMFTKEWLPWVLDTKQEDPADSLDVLAKTNDDGSVISLYVVNYGTASHEREIKIDNFNPESEIKYFQLGPHVKTARNSGENHDLISPVTYTKNIGKNNYFSIEFPAYSFVVIRMDKKL